jgi:transcription-repair coupling factor (superfamily II helicase)
VGGRTWLRQKAAAERAVLDLAVEMLQMQAIRLASPGIAFQPDSQWQREFDASFPYHATPDQLEAIAAIKQDMQRPRPMDRLLCGDVGFGKTEVAMRAAFKAVDSGYQVAVLVPTTILAEQHYRSFTERMAEFPIDLAKLSRFCTPEEERATLQGLRSGRVDIVIGTHRLVSKDVQFRNLGLVIIDEEQRFGVEVKERLKALRATVDVLTLSATPIPRTLHMSLVGLRDISNLQSPPEDRLAVETKVSRWDDQLIRHAILRELARGGQIYFVHNRVGDIELVAHRLRQIVPDVRLRIGHAQMPDEELERVMVDFVAHRFDLLLATTIVESGLDIPNANTIFINEADRYGLADLHQLRGRVGRYKHRAYCYLLIEPHKHLTPNAARRLHAIEEFDELGAGFAIAMRDLEIRGAGNLLGTQQSGHIAAVGYELYCQLLENAVRTLQQQPPKTRFEVDIQLPGETLLPDDYIPDLRLKVDLYRRLTRVETPEQIDELAAEMLDRFGPLPPPVQRLVELTRLRLDAANWRISAIYREGDFVVLQYADRARIEPLLARHRGKLRLVDERSLYLPLPRGADPTRLWQLVKSVLRSDESTTTIPPRALPARGSGEVVVTGNTS